MIERIVIDVLNDTEFVDVSVHWVGGFVSHHQVQRPILKYDQLRDFELLLNRLRELRETNRTAAQIADQLNQDGFYSPGKRPFNKAVVRQLLSRLGIVSECPATVVLGPNEWWARQLAKTLSMPYSTLQHWIVRGWVQFRRTPDRGFRIFWADENELERLRQLYRHTKAHHRGPSATKIATTECLQSGAKKSKKKSATNK